tara:strand:- start:213 stop:542 length:330 start_codon:yes stop_codon:yes gene_type:complete
MAKNVKPRVKVPKSAAVGESIVIKTLIKHKMESGQRKDKDGKTIPRSIINRFVCDFNGQNVIDVSLEPAISTNPFIQFEAVVLEAGEYKFFWYDDDGSVYEKTKKIAVG